MPEKYRVGIIGVGLGRGRDGQMRGRLGYAHAYGYENDDRCEIVACADISQEHADAFVKAYPEAKAYLNHEEMLVAENLDIVSVCTRPILHAPLTISAGKARVKAILCEKPMAITWGESKDMAQVCEDNGVQLSIGHQRRFCDPFTKAKDLLDEGVIGDLVRLEASCPNLYDWGTHWFDMMFMYNNNLPAKWVIGQIDCRAERSVFDVRLESQGLSELVWENGVRGVMFTGYESSIGCANRLIGTHGTIEVGVTDGPVLRVRGKGDGDWRKIPTEDNGLSGRHLYPRVARNIVDCLESGDEPVLSARKALQATEIIFATYESSRRRARIDLPLDVDGSPLAEMIEAGEVG